MMTTVKVNYIVELTPEEMRLVSRALRERLEGPEECAAAEALQARIMAARAVQMRQYVSQFEKAERDSERSEMGERRTPINGQENSQVIPRQRPPTEKIPYRDKKAYRESVPVFTRPAKPQT